jgi:hypothetical protein
MSTVKLRDEIKKAIDQLPRERLESLADYVAFLNRPSVSARIAAADAAFASGKGKNWRKVRKDV